MEAAQLRRHDQTVPERAVNYGFVIDNRKCIGCHACSVACKSENEVPLGVNRTWVKYVETGALPRRAAPLPGHALQPLRQPALRAHLPHRGDVPAGRRHRGVRQQRLHRLQGVHAGLPLRRHLHRPDDGHRRQVPLLRPPHGHRPGAGLRGRLPGAGHHRRGHERPRQPDQPAPGARRTSPSASRSRARRRSFSTSRATTSSCIPRRLSGRRRPSCGPMSCRCTGSNGHDRAQQGPPPDSVRNMKRSDVTRQAAQAIRTPQSQGQPWNGPIQFGCDHGRTHGAGGLQRSSTRSPGTGRCPLTW